MSERTCLSPPESEAKHSTAGELPSGTGTGEPGYCPVFTSILKNDFFFLNKS